MFESTGPFDRAARLLEQALALSLENRAAFLDRACGQDASLRAMLDDMLRAQTAQGPFLADNGPESQTDSIDRAASKRATTTDMTTDEADRLVGSRIGPYKLLELLGEGGFGAVYVAEQEKPVRRRVALKVIKLGMDTRQVIARFEAERQALAMMDHPNIARVLDAGATESGRPWFAMELVRGVPITQYCDAAHLPAAERLALFTDVCFAVQHAHQKGVIHRDIKPSNVLVTLHDGKPIPKVIDFGIAKAVGQQLTDKTVYTMHRQMIGTPAYMSPEQAEMSGLDVDTRADVYSLGVLLYELLTGSPPFTAAELNLAGWEGMQRIIREKEPLKPSTRISTLAAGRRVTGSAGVSAADGMRDVACGLPGELSIVTIAAKRRIEPAKLSALLRGDLDWIAMKCLEKDRTRRYGTANDLASDVQRHLKGEPVIAAPPSVGYRLRKFVSKHRGQVVAASLVALSVTIGLTATTVLTVMYRDQRNYAQEEKQRADVQADNAEWNAYIAGISAAQAAISVGNWHEARERLAACPESKRDWEWRFLIQRVASTIELPAADYAAFSPDSQRVLTMAAFSARQWSVSTGQPYGETMRHDGAITGVAYSLDGTRVLTASDDRTARMWDATTGRPYGEVMKHDGEVRSAVFSSDGMRVLTVSADKIARLWDSSTGRPHGEEMKHPDLVYSAAFSSDGTHVLTVSGVDTARLWNATTGRSYGEVMKHRHAVRTGIFSPDGARVLTITGEGVARLWDAATGRSCGAPMKHDFSFESVVFSPDGKQLLSASSDGTARLWDAATGQPNGITMDHGSTVNLATFSPDGRSVLTASKDKTARLWDSATGLPRGVVMYHDGDVRSAVYNAQGTAILTVSNDNIARMWDTSGRCLGKVTVTPPPEVISFGGYSGSFSRDGQRVIITVCRDTPSHVVSTSQFDWPELRLYGDDVSTELQLILGEANVTMQSKFGSHTREENISVTNPNASRCVIAQSDRSVRFIDKKTGHEAAVMGIKDEARVLAFTPDGMRLIIQFDDKSAVVWDAREPSARQADRDARAAERSPAEEFVDTLLAGDLPTDSLENHIRRDAQSTALSRLVRLQVLRERLEWIENKAESVLESLKCEHISIARVRHAAEAFLEKQDDVSDNLARKCLQRRIGQRVVKQAYDWKPTRIDLENLAWDAVKASNTQPNRVEAAVNAAREAVSIGTPEPFDQASAINTLGTALYRHGEYAKAIIELERSDRLYAIAKNAESPPSAPQQPENWAFIAMSHFQLGRASEAKSALKKFRTLMREEEHFDDEDFRQFLCEAEELIEDRATTQLATSQPAEPDENSRKGRP